MPKMWSLIISRRLDGKILLYIRSQSELFRIGRISHLLQPLWKSNTFDWISPSSETGRKKWRKKKEKNPRSSMVLQACLKLSLSENKESTDTFAMTPHLLIQKDTDKLKNQAIKIPQLSMNNDSKP